LPEYAVNAARKVTRNIAFFVAFVCLLALGAVSAARAQVVVNGATIEPAFARRLAASIGGVARDGNYWYDRATGAFGVFGQATLGFLPPGLALGGPLSPHASGGGDGRFGGVFINGRELHPQDIAGLQQMIGQVVPGRYWVDAQGTFGLEGGAPLGNLHALAQSRGARAPRGSTPSTCGNDVSCMNSHSWLGDNYFSDGKTGCIVMDGEISC
jgi:hypothetical protein